MVFGFQAYTWASDNNNEGYHQEFLESVFGHCIAALYHCCKCGLKLTFCSQLHPCARVFKIAQNTIECYNSDSTYF